MKSARKVFAIAFLTLYLLYAGNAFIAGHRHVAGAIADSFPVPQAMHFYASESGFGWLPFRVDLLKEHAHLQVLLGKTENNGLDIIAANHGAYVQGTAPGWNAYSIEQFAIRLYKLQQSLTEAGLDTKVTYISAQPQIINGYTEPLEPFPLPDENLMMKSLLYYLRAYNIDFLDTQFVLEGSALSASEYIYKTDTLWTTQASFATAQALVGKLNGQYAAGIDPGWHYYNEDNFERTTYDDLFMGTMGMRAGEPFTGREAFTTIVPAYETDFTCRLTGTEERVVTGGFEETLFNPEHLYPADPYAYSAYSVYMDGGAYYQRAIVNHALPEAPKALFIHDRSALPFAAFTALGFAETHMYWPALAPESTDFDITAYAAEHDIDYVFFLAECSYYALEGVFQWLPNSPD